MKPLPNATIMWNEQEIEERESLVRIIPSIIKSAWTNLNSAVKMARVEMPCICNTSDFSSHISEGFPVMLLHNPPHTMLRPETTASTIAALKIMYPNPNQIAKQLPLCLWQVGKSFRNEENSGTMRSTKLRLREFYQIEFQLFAQDGTKADYIGFAIDALCKRFGGEKILVGDPPHYSESTIDWDLDNIEVASCSVRKDWDGGMLFEVSIGLDRLVHHILKGRSDE